MGNIANTTTGIPHPHCGSSNAFKPSTTSPHSAAALEPKPTRCSRLASTPEILHQPHLHPQLTYLVAVGSIPHKANLSHVGARTAVGAASHAHGDGLITKAKLRQQVKHTPAKQNETTARHQSTSCNDKSISNTMPIVQY
jgi:hypothetical protein